MRMPSTYLDRRTAVDLQLTPMIDCVFLLMVYFIWSSSFTISEQLLPSELSMPSPSGSGAVTTDAPPPEEDFEDIVIRVVWRDGAASWTVNDTPVASLGALRDMLANIARIKRDAPVVLDPAGQAPLGEVIRVFDLARLAGFEKVQFAADP